ncbi:MAG: sulfatase-like hydrolase/transferase, partial [Phycisphaerae bacterium]|nr:sulfatase-like hydrolase/transferase [Phycisphaerae bacterium]
VLFRSGGRHRASDDSGQPFFAALSVQPPHDPYLAPPEYMERHNPATLQMRPNVPDTTARTRGKARRELAGYYAQIENLDHNVGRVVQTVCERGLGDNTWIIFFSDHGDMHGSHGQFRKMSPYEEALRIPFIVWTQQARYDLRCRVGDVPVNHVDIAPTTLGLCGIDTPPAMQGTDYSGLIVPGRDAGEVPDSAYVQSVVPTGHGDSVDRPWRGVVTRDGWKYVCLEGQPWMLYDLNDDPYEQANLAHNTIFGGRRRELHRRLARWVEATGDEFALPEIG